MSVFDEKFKPSFSGRDDSTYDQRIVLVFRDLCQQNRDGASPSEVTYEMFRRKWLTELDTVIDIERIMRRLRSSGRL